MCASQHFGTRDFRSGSKALIASPARPSADIRSSLKAVVPASVATAAGALPGATITETGVMSQIGR